AQTSQAVALEKPLVVVVAEGRRVDASAVAQDQAGLLPPGFTESNEFHGILRETKPPSMGKLLPVMNDAASEQRKSASSATSSGLPMRPMGCVRESWPNISASRPG